VIEWAGTTLSHGGFMRHHAFVLLLLGICSASPAWAAGIVVGRGLGRECYEQTLSQPSPIRNVLALEICSRAEEDYSADAHTRAAAFVNRADILLQMGRYREAVSDADRAITFDGRIGTAHLNRGAGLIGMERYGEALSALNRAIDLDGGKTEIAYFDRGLAREYLGDVQGAYYDYRKAAELAPDFELASRQLARFTVRPR
jgi:tetratricopeptide (TPR) repeat protein